ncbi:DUF4956 domain-containing protein [Candidatus Nanosyncoccus alces]|uniref:DUF4956 domain-containing protein n=1 Tax=Candidatus Nanosyncoccus alces TaxID=2171997 RepID=A0ABY0FNE5_9BACT|nr:DUF4956 domain-containing protein [Candidatus Nanosyncoccus alces]RYC74410.1 hypothetical protein G3RUM_00564 [Candidatus Nanosyncoccus alces]
MFNSVFDSTTTGLSITTGLICAAVALVLGIVIAITHMKTSQTTKGFLTTLATLPLLVMAVMIMINGNLGTSIAILGAFSLIRFRSIQGQAKDLLSVFFAMMVGLACGMGHILFAVVITVIAVIAILIFSYTHFLEPNKKQRVLKIVVPEDLDYEEVFDEIFQKYTSRAELTRMKTMNMGSLYKLTYDITMKGGVKEKEFLDEIRIKNCNLKVLLSHPCMEEEI